MTRARLLLAAGLVSIALVARADLFSPGELARPHQALEGLSQCTKCHPAGGQLSQESCLSCHPELKPRIAQGAGLHGKLQGEKRNCETCHHEHQGLDAKLIDWGAGTGKPAGESDFNHLRTGWSLKGAHAELKCASCHEKRRVLWPVALKLLSVRPATRLGLGTTCAQCHFDEHRGQQQEDCEYCHAEKVWKPAPNFNHNDTAYALKGKHVKVKCTGCHDGEKDVSLPNGFPAPKSETFLRFAPVDHRSCLDCHRDPHEGRFGLRCQSCHTVEGWHVVRNAGAEREFHQKTRFPLEGAHLDVDCKNCHGPFPGQAAKFKGLAHEGCNTCHVDAHVGQLPPAPQSKAPDCATCHTVQGFTPTKFGLLEHVKTRFPLDGAHQVVPCASCHPATPTLKAKVPRVVLVDLAKKKRQELFSAALFDFVKPLDKCESCHRDVHDGQFVPRSCSVCHPAGAGSFKGAAVRFEHATTAFPLEGAHVKVECAKCHFATVPGAPVKYRPLPQTCASCHLDVHAGQFSVVPGRPPSSCESCHGNASWKDLRFEHRPPFTTFVLDGQHAKAKCESCHRSVPVAPKVNVIQYRPLPATCEGCHSDFHKGAFKGFEP